MKFTLDYEKATQLCHNALEMKKSGQYPFNKAPEEIFPDAKVPDGMLAGSKAHFLYLFHAISLDSMTRAVQVYRGMHDLVSRVELSRLHHADRDIIRQSLSVYFDAGEKSLTQPVETLITNSRMLAEKYKGDPKNLVDEDIWKTMNNIDAFVQYGPGKAALLIKNAVRFGVWTFPKTDVPIKIDRHLLRISLGSGVLVPEESSWMNPDWSGLFRSRKESGLPVSLYDSAHQVIRAGYFSPAEFLDDQVQIVRGGDFVLPLMHLYWDITRREGIDAIELDDAKWAIGANICKANDKRICDTHCAIGCGVRMPSDNNAVWFYRGVDKRNHKVHLFSK